MYLVELYQNDRQHIVGLFDKKADAKDWIESLSYVQKHVEYFDEIEFVTYTMQYEDLPLYEEILWQESRFPLTKYMFTPDDGTIELIIQDKLPLMNEVKGVVEGMTQVDAYLLPNTEVKNYIQAREEIREAITKYYTNLGKKVEAGGVGSQDGEYLVIEDGPFIHLDALTVQEWQDKTSLKNFIQQIEN